MNPLAILAWAAGRIGDAVIPRKFRKEDKPPMMTPFQAGPLTLSPDSIELIIESEVGSRSYYEKRLMHPTWPGGASGITIGFGYDIGYNTPTQIHGDWDGLLPAPHVERLARDSGVKGEKAKSLVRPLGHISVPWEAAEIVFNSRTLPRYAKMTAQAFPGIEKLHPHIQGALVSIVFNRGNALEGARRLEMRAIRDLVAQGKPAGIPAQIRKMKRLWVGKGLDGLLKRREAEAALVEMAL